MLNTYGHITEQTAGKAAAVLLKRLQGLVLWERFIQVDALGKNKTRTKTWRRYNPFPDITAPLSEGVTPPGQELTYTDYNATLEQWGAVSKLTDVIQDTHTDPVLNQMFKLAGEQAAKTLERVRQNTFQGGSNVYYAGAVTSRATVDGPVQRGDLRKVTRAFGRFNIEMISEIIKASQKISTQPISSAYFAIGHTDLKPDLQGVSGYVPVAEYADSNMRIKGEVGAIDDIRFCLTSLATPWETSGASGTIYLSGGAAVAVAAQADVYPLCIFGRDFGAGVRLQGANAIQPIVLNPNNPAPGDELGQRGSVGWKTMQANVILQQMAIARLEVAATANPS